MGSGFSPPTIPTVKYEGGSIMMFVCVLLQEGALYKVKCTSMLNTVCCYIYLLCRSPEPCYRREAVVRPSQITYLQQKTNKKLLISTDMKCLLYIVIGFSAVINGSSSLSQAPSWSEKQFNWRGLDISDSICCS